MSCSLKLLNDAFLHVCVYSVLRLSAELKTQRFESQLSLFVALNTVLCACVLRLAATFRQREITEARVRMRGTKQWAGRHPALLHLYILFNASFSL